MKTPWLVHPTHSSVNSTVNPPLSYVLTSEKLEVGSGLARWGRERGGQRMRLSKNVIRHFALKCHPLGPKLTLLASRGLGQNGRVENLAVGCRTPCRQHDLTQRE